MLMLVVLLLLALCAAETRPRDTIFINGERRWARRSSGGEFRDIIDPGRASREDQKLTHLRGSDRGGWVPEWAPRWSKELVTKV